SVATLRFLNRSLALCGIGRGAFKQLERENLACSAPHLSLAYQTRRPQRTHGLSVFRRRLKTVFEDPFLHRRRSQLRTRRSHAAEVSDVCLHPGEGHETREAVLRTAARLQTEAGDCWWRGVRICRSHVLLHVSDAERRHVEREPGVLAG